MGLFFKMHPKVDSTRWAHPSAVWALKECPALQIYIGRRTPRGPKQWITVIDRETTSPIPPWLERLAEQGRLHQTDPNTTHLLTEHKFQSRAEAIAAILNAKPAPTKPSSLKQVLLQP